MFDTFHAFFGAIVVFATPVAAVAIWWLWLHFRAMGRLRLAIVMLVVGGMQVELGILPVINRLQGIGPGAYAPVPLDVVAAIQALPADSKLAYACHADEEYGFWVPRLVSIYAHTGRRVVPMCYESDLSSRFIGGDPSIQVESPVWKFAPQRVLYRDATMQPSAESVEKFLKEYDIRYIFADSQHPNSLVPDAVPIASHGAVEVLKIP